ncbi:MAG: hypothetical protein ACTSXL_05705 [Alphaproteobacteria bacterium]
MKILKIDTPFKGYQAYRFESKSLCFTAYEKDFSRRFIIEDTFDKVAPFHRIIVPIRKNETNIMEPEDKWDTILEEDLGIDQNEIRPKKNNLYQKLEAGYEGVNLYFRLLKDPENQKLRQELEILRISQSLYHATERYNFDKEEHETAQKTKKTSARTLENQEKTGGNFKEKLEKEKTSLTPDDEKINDLVERVYHYETKIKNTKRRIERAEKRFEKAEIDVVRAKNRIDYLKSLMKNGVKVREDYQPAPIIIKNVKSEVKPIEIPKKKETKLPKQNITIIKKEKSKISCHIYYLMIIAILLGVIGWLLMKPQMEQNPIQNEPANCPVIEKIVEIEKIIEVEKECPICETPIAEKTETEAEVEPKTEKPAIVEAILEDIPEEMPSEYKSAKNEREIYKREVLNHQKQAPFDFAKVLDKFSTNYLTTSNTNANDINASIRNFNTVWNNFRRASYHEYYSDDKVLRPDLEKNKPLKNQYHNDEKILFEYSKRYQKMFSDVAGQFLQTENASGFKYLKQIKQEMKLLGHPKYKLFLMQQMRKAMQ